jgi:hypothetical protein
MTTQELINAAFMLAGGLGGFILRATWQALETMRKDLQMLQASMSETYVRRDDFRDAVGEIKDLLHDIRNELRSKVDK